MPYFLLKITQSVAIVIVLSGCSVTYDALDSVEAPKSETKAPVMTPMQYSWNTGYSAMLTPPLEIREKALVACQQRGFDRAYMQSVSLVEDRATAKFSCRGSDQ